MRRFGHNTLRVRVIGIMSAVFLVVAVSFVVLLDRIVTRSFSELEAGNVRRSAVGVRALFYSDVESLEELAADHVGHGDISILDERRYSAYAQEHLSSQVLRDADADFVLVLDGSGDVVYSAAVGATANAPAQMHGAVKRSLADVGNSFGAHGRGDTRSGFLALPGASAAVAMHKVRAEEASEPAGGVLLVGRYIGSEEVARVEGMARLDVQAARPTARAAILPRHPYGAGEVLGRIYVDTQDDRRLKSWTTVRGVDSRAAFVMTVDQPRSLMEQASWTVTWVGVGLLALTFLFGLALATTLEFSVMRRLTKLHDEVLSSGGTSANGRRVTVEGDDEIAELAAALNRNFDGLAEAEAALVHAADHDFLTGLLNRRRLEEDTVKALSEAERYGHTVAYMLFDLDGFKEINDTLGHDCGDAVLMWFSDVLHSEVRGYTSVARVGGDEFAILMPRAGDYEAAVVADRVMTVLGERTCDVCEGVSLEIGASVGIAVSPRDGNSMSDLSRAADNAMYATKSSRARDCGES